MSPSIARSVPFPALLRSIAAAALFTVPPAAAAQSWSVAPFTGIAASEFDARPADYLVEPSLLTGISTQPAIGRRLALELGALHTWPLARIRTECAVTCGPPRSISFTAAYAAVVRTLPVGQYGSLTLGAGAGPMAVSRAETDSYASSGTILTAFPTVGLYRSVAHDVGFGFTVRDMMMFPHGSRTTHIASAVAFLRWGRG
jgi:hypothetical protein